MVNPEDAQNTISRQCELLGISRNAYYYEPKFSDFKLRVMTCIDELYTKDPTSGQRKLQANLKKYYGIDVGRRLIRHLMEIMQIAAIYPKPNLSFPNKMNKTFPYLLRNVAITHVNQVWSTDITYIRLKNGFAYLTAVIDWYSRRILSWRLSTTLSTDFCEEAVREAIDKFGWPEIFNTDQGCQYTSEQFTSIFNWDGCPTRLSMDSKGRAYDNIFVERFWRTLKQDDIYTKGYETVTECRQGLEAYLARYNDVRLHSSLDWNTPSDVYFKKVRLDKVA
ncbi:putative transposase [Fibrobacter intestinalis]|uniref:Putative transposase n=1 Tax=Fibrobacter intestinalis TaxID=28122 RepID=A0A1M6QDA5_9BACT|nr:putative transposase [Fibrobacter intestinalis]